MNRYAADVKITKTYIATKTYRVEVEAEDEEAAHEAARERASEMCMLSNYDTEHEETDREVDALWVLQSDIPEEIPQTPRCRQTVDMCRTAGAAC